MVYLTGSKKNETLDTILHQPVRTRLVAFLAARGEATFKELKELLQVTDGNLDAHMRKLQAVKYIVSRKEMIDRRNQTFYRLTDIGHKKFKEYVLLLQHIFSTENH